MPRPISTLRQLLSHEERHYRLIWACIRQFVSIMQIVLTVLLIVVFCSQLDMVLDCIFTRATLC